MRGKSRTQPAIEALESRTLLSARLVEVATSWGLAAADMEPFGERVVMTGATQSQGRELWITDGTATGTRMIRDIYPGTSSSNPKPLGQAGKWFYFFAAGGSSQYTIGMWRTDGTSKNTALVLRLRSDEAKNLNSFTDLQGQLLFVRHLPSGWISSGDPMARRLVQG
jgi:ELWxxDGT repeat protein